MADESVNVSKHIKLMVWSLRGGLYGSRRLQCAAVEKLKAWISLENSGKSLWSNGTDKVNVRCFPWAWFCLVVRLTIKRLEP